MNAAALTALVDRWRPETHTFHLRAGEMTPTLQDISMILGLPIQGEPLWANRDTLRTYTRVYLWYMISRTLFPDSGGKLAHWCWLKTLTVLEHRWRSTSIASELNFVNTARKMRRLANLLGCRDGEIPTSSSEEAEIPDDDAILSQSISRGKKQATRSAYQLKPRGKAPNRYTPDDYVNRGKNVVIEEDEAPPRRSSLRRMRNDEPLSSEEEEPQEQEQQQQEPRQRTKRMAVRKQPMRRGRRG
ncbi:hypothetical protein QYE76_071815 [Lolium multiflorum]|uniref:Aminotransferase-like plant mobile domain-containing protein n=1 Tax=Lolium multiflorum TaxID=4521 RepID=A0AAD8SKI9_LOLMU|nr:hypothetical protein QYE76_071815 [Lolium multiflorum]